MLRKAIVKGLGSRGRQDFVERLVEEIAQGDVTGMIEATGHDTSVHQHAYLIAEGIAEDILFLKLGMVGIRPLEHAVVLDVEILTQLPSVVTLCPRTGLVLGNQLLNEIVGGIISALIPKTKDDEHTL